MSDGAIDHVAEDLIKGLVSARSHHYRTIPGRLDADGQRLEALGFGARTLISRATSPEGFARAEFDDSQTPPVSAQ